MGRILVSVLVALALVGCATPGSGPAGAGWAQAPGELDYVDPSTQEGVQALRELVTDFLDDAQGYYAPEASRSADLPDLLALIPLRQSPQDWTVLLQAGQSYVFLGGCDNECTNLDIDVLDPGNAIVATDRGPSDFPVVRYRALESGPFTVRAHLRVCTVEPCMIGVRVLTE